VGCLRVGAQSSTVIIFPPCTLATHSPLPRLLDIDRCNKKFSFLPDKECCRDCKDKFEEQVRALSETIWLDEGWAVCGNQIGSCEITLFDNESNLLLFVPSICLQLPSSVAKNVQIYPSGVIPQGDTLSSSGRSVEEDGSEGKRSRGSFACYSGLDYALIFPDPCMFDTSNCIFTTPLPHSLVKMRGQVRERRGLFGPPMISSYL